MGKFRICFAGTPEFASAHLSALYESQHEVVAVYTQPDRPAGRGKSLQPSPVKRVAETYSIPVYQPDSLRSAEQHSILAGLNPDVLVVVAYGLILPADILNIPRFGCINVHASLLPRWRGAAPIERALLSGDKKSGITIMQMDEGLDTGDMLYQIAVPIAASDTRIDLENSLCLAGQKALLYTLDNLQQLLKTAMKQDDTKSCYAEKLQKSESLIDWVASAETVNRTIRAGIGRAPAFTYLQGSRIRILRAAPSSDSFDQAPGTIVRVDKESFQVACSASSLLIYTVQLPGKNPVTVRDIFNSRPDSFAVGKTLSNFDSVD
ncbi:MAG: methionyl-tRNA formyltransferase [Gammaproteobacteria bacterium]|jgi:methionyl-tRNA formyltransferase|nr:methionyl-tRNA formyltransferase [Gammaproteobacteria bacterium]MDP6732592.1 methionyl-tRNA formyltransferase [Gammaproteobacteria bacterium]